MADCSRWEIGEEPQPQSLDPIPHFDCSRWEIGEEPQLFPLCYRLLDIVADGRSGRNRNRRELAQLCRPIVADGRSGRNRNWGIVVVIMRQL